MSRTCLPSKLIDEKRDVTYADKAINLAHAAAFPIDKHNINAFRGESEVPFVRVAVHVATSLNRVLRAKQRATYAPAQRLDYSRRRAVMRLLCCRAYAPRQAAFREPFPPVGLFD